MDKVLIKKWYDLMGAPQNYSFTASTRLIRKIQTPDFDGEIYEQANGPGTVQQTLLMLPKNHSGQLPAVAVPFYYPDKVAGYDLQTLTPLEHKGAVLGLPLVRRGYAVITAESFHLTYTESGLDRNDFSRWRYAGERLLKDHPDWTGIGKLVADTRLIIDLLCGDSRINTDRIAIAGHSLGGKMALYTGCLDSRIKAILGSDFGIGWDMTNWDDCWYWGNKVNELKSAGIDHAQLLQAGGLKPFVLLAGKYDTQESLDYLIKAGYKDRSQYLFINHATGHRPPDDILEKGYDFLTAAV